MSVGFQTLVAFFLFLGMLVGSISLIVCLLRRRLQESKNSLIVVLAFVATYLGFMEYLGHDYGNRLLGKNIERGENTVNFSCCYDHHGDGTDVNIYEGEVVEYASLDLVALKSLPDSSLNNNGYKYEQKWTPVSEKTEVNLRAIELAKQAVSSVDRAQQRKAEEIFNLLMSHEGSFYAYIYDDRYSIDFWVINPGLAKFVAINYYN